MVVSVEPTPFTSLRDSADQQLRAGKFDEAIRLYQAALQRSPHDIATLFSLGNAFAASEDWAASSETFDTVIQQRPQSAAAYFNKANADRELGDLPAAIEGFRKAVELTPSADGWNNLGAVLAQNGKLPESTEAFRAAVDLDPDSEAAQLNLIQSLRLLGDIPNAVHAAHTALARHQNSLRMLVLLGDIWLQAKVLPNAVSCFERALAISPDDASLHLRLGIAHSGTCQLSQAEEHLRRALALGASPATVHANLGEVARKRRDLAAAMTHQRKSLELEPRPDPHSNLLVTMLYDASVSGRQLREEAANWQQLHAAGIQPLPSVPPRVRSRLRVGYISGSLHQHPVGLFIEPVLKHHDRDRFEVYCYAHQEFADEVTERLRGSSDHWTVVNNHSDESLARQIREDEIDVLIDLCGHTWPNRLLAFAYRAAPVQLTWMGFSATTGLASVDGILGDRWATPCEDADHFVENVVRLPGHYLCFAEPTERVPVHRASDADGFTFGCFNNAAKIGPCVIEVWSNILRDAPGSRLFLKSPSFSDAASRADIIHAFQQHGIAPARLQLEGQGSREDFLQAYRQVDLALDPFPFHGGMTTMETLWMGVPLVTLVGDRFVSRVGESLLRAVGLEQQVTHSAENYQRLAVAAAASIWSDSQREQLRQRFLDSPLCQTDEFTRQLEATYQQLIADRTASSEAR